MTKPISSYPKEMQIRVIERRMRQYDPKGFNGLGTLSAKAAGEAKLAKIKKNRMTK